MVQNELKKTFSRSVNRRLIKLTILIIASGLTLAMMVLPLSSRPSFFALKVGDVAPQDIQAPMAISYPSEVTTEQMRHDAEQNVSQVFLPADPSIARRQIEMLRASLNFIGTVRDDMHATQEQKLADLSALENIQLGRSDAQIMLNLSQARWQMVQQESLSVLEQIMRDMIREGQLADAQRRIPTLISFSLPQDLSESLAHLVTPFVIPNSLFSPEMTAVARQDARNRIETVVRSYAAGETIVRRGQILTPSSMEALSKFGLIERPNNLRDVLGSLSLVVCLAVFVALYFTRRSFAVLDNLRALALIAFTFLLFFATARLIIPNRAVLPYVFPIAAFGLVIACLFNSELGMVLSLVLGILTGYGMFNSLDLTFYYILSSLFGILMLSKGQRISNFVFAGLGAGTLGAVIILAYRLPDATTDLAGLATLAGASLLNGLSSASMALILQALFAQILGLSTALQLLEISRPDHPLQQFLIQNAPGSYQHSLQVGILAEQAAERIRADSILVRVGAIYHDVGKALNPSFFIENQVGKLNPHDDLDPAVSAQTIIRHVSDGVQLAKKHHMPSRILDFIREHHGTMLTRYQYARALEEAEGKPELVDVSLFQYAGPRPQSRETALLMLADGCQARARAELPQSEEEMHALVRKVIDQCQRDGQLDDTKLTLRDLNLIAESFVNTLQNSFHPRIRYPEPRQPSAQLAEAPIPIDSVMTDVPTTPITLPLRALPPISPQEAAQLFRPTVNKTEPK